MLCSIRIFSEKTHDVLKYMVKGTAFVFSLFTCIKGQSFNRRMNKRPSGMVAYLVNIVTTFDKLGLTHPRLTEPLL